jgi:hypothetical protein
VGWGEITLKNQFHFSRIFHMLFGDARIHPTDYVINECVLNLVGKEEEATTGGVTFTISSSKY